jgi:hypothetical protein
MNKEWMNEKCLPGQRVIPGQFKGR